MSIYVAKGPELHTICNIFFFKQGCWTILISNVLNYLISNVLNYLISNVLNYLILSFNLHLTEQSSIVSLILQRRLSSPISFQFSNISIFILANFQFSSISIFKFAIFHCHQSHCHPSIFAAMFLFFSSAKPSFECKPSEKNSDNPSRLTDLCSECAQNVLWVIFECVQSCHKMHWSRNQSCSSDLEQLLWHWCWAE